MALTYTELSALAAVTVRKINKENSIKLVKVMTILGKDGIVDCVVYRDNDWNEYRVLQFVSGAYVPTGDYHTDDKQDAEDTAIFLANPKFQEA